MGFENPQEISTRILTRFMDPHYWQSRSKTMVPEDASPGGGKLDQESIYVLQSTMSWVCTIGNDR